MAYTSEIDKLERRYAENPKGRNFAPLADAYRKAGQLDQAIELCKNGLERHPDYVSAYIVYGRCLIDKKDDAGADEVFHKVLSFDPENIIALRVLGEIAERSGRFDQGVEWLTRLLAADPMNGDAAEALARMKTKAAAQPMRTVEGLQAEPVASLVPPGANDLTIERTSVVTTIPLEAATAAPKDLETFDGVELKASNDVARADGLELQEEVELNSALVDTSPVEGLASTQYHASGAFKVDESALSADAPPPVAPAPPEPELLDDDMPTVDLPLIMPDDVSTPAPRRGPPPRPTPPPAPALMPLPLPEPTPAPVTPAPRAADDEGAADAGVLSHVEPVLTETMAELYLQQGHRSDALRVYQALLAQRPGDPHLTAKIAQLSGQGTPAAAASPARSRSGGSGETVGAFLKGVLSGRRATPPPAPAPALAPATAAAPPPAPPPPAPSSAPAPRPSGPSGSTLDSAFGAAAEPETAAPQVGKPTRPADDSISLDSVFGDEAGHASGPHPGAPPPRPSGSGGGFSFDDFFGGSGPGSAPPPPPAADAPGAPPDEKSAGPKPPVGARGRPGAEDEVDLDQFQSWLKGLKG